jgi:hypothetical protein
MNALFVIVLVLLCVLFCGLGFLIARSWASTESGKREADLKVAEERARQFGKQADALRAERDDLKERADRLERAVAKQSYPFPSAWLPQGGAPNDQQKPRSSSDNAARRVSCVCSQVPSDAAGCQCSRNICGTSSALSAQSRPQSESPGGITGAPG